MVSPPPPKCDFVVAPATLFTLKPRACTVKLFGNCGMLISQNSVKTSRGRYYVFKMHTCLQYIMWLRSQYCTSQLDYY